MTKGGIGGRRKKEEGTGTDTQGYIARRTQKREFMVKGKPPSNSGKSPI